MPDPLPQPPDFGFFNDPGDEHAPPVVPNAVTYPQPPETVTRVNGSDFETAEIERLRAQLTAARQALADVYDAFPVFIRERLEPLQAILERE